MITRRNAQDRGHANHGWLDSWHTFSFADYYDPKHMHFRSLRVINDDTVAGGGGFGMHPHRDMEIITYVVSGALQHRDSMGNSAVMRAGDVQRISAGTGIQHSEFNHSPLEPVHLFQIWILPDKHGVTPGYAEKSFAQVETGKLHRVASKTGQDGSIPINQNTELLLARLEPGQTVEHAIQPGRHAWVQVAVGDVTLASGETLRSGDAVAVSKEPSVRISANQPSQVLLFDLE
jgi:quercetin 2,3-dioxygenase